MREVVWWLLGAIGRRLLWCLLPVALVVICFLFTLWILLDQLPLKDPLE